ncbi:hypothetical protein Tco_0353646 [Tanacetum coccineum]
MAALRTAKYKAQTERYYNKKVKHKALKVGDFVLRKNEASRKEGQRKLDPNWEGPYQVAISLALDVSLDEMRRSFAEQFSRNTPTYYPLVWLYWLIIVSLCKSD